MKSKIIDMWAWLMHPLKPKFGLMTSSNTYCSRIECQYLSPEKVLLDSRFNPRIAGVGKSYFKSQEHTETNHGDFHRSLSYLDVHLRSKEENHSKNVLWSVGRCMSFLANVPVNTNDKRIVTNQSTRHLISQILNNQPANWYIVLLTN